MDDEGPFGAGDVAMVSDTHVHVDLWPLSVVEQVVSSSNGCVGMGNVRTAKGAPMRDVYCTSLLEREEGADDTIVSESGQ